MLKKCHFIFGFLFLAICVSANSANLHSHKPIIQSGSILFAVLDTAINNGHLNGLVIATILDGRYKGAKVSGQLSATKSGSGTLDKLILKFTSMNIKGLSKPMNFTA